MSLAPQIAPPTNQAVSTPKKPFFQAKLTVNEPGDAYEQEADAVADRVMRMPDPVAAPTFHKVSISGLQRKCASCEEEEKVQRKESEEDEQPVQLKRISDFTIQRQCDSCEEEVQRKEAGTDGGGMTAPSIVSEVISGNGSPLDKGTRQFMESRMGQDFSNVQIHTDGKAAASAQSINALAYTSGPHIVFNSGQYQPHTDGGKRLLAHELVHTAQQGGSIKRQAESEVAPASVCADKSSETPVEEPKGPETETSIPDNFKGGKTKVRADNQPANPQPIQEGSEKDPAAPQKSELEKAVTKPSEDGAFQALAGDTKRAKKSQNQHDKAENIAKEAELSAKEPAEKSRQTGEADKVLATEEKLAAMTPFSRDIFKANIKKMVEGGLPKDENANKEFKTKDGIGTLTGSVGKEVANAQEPTKEILVNINNAQAPVGPNQQLIYEKKVEETAPEEPGRKAKIGQSERAVPKPVPQETVLLDEEHNADSLDRAMEDEQLKEFDTKLTNDQLADSQEKEFTETLTTKQEAQVQLCQIPAKNRDAEFNSHQQEADRAQEVLNKGMNAKFSKRKNSIGEVNDGKSKTQREDEALLAAYYSKIAGIYTTAKTNVDEKLKQLDAISDIFSDAMTKANDTFKSSVTSRLNDYYGVGVFNLSEEDEDAWQRAAKGDIAGQIFWLKTRKAGLTDPREIAVIDQRIRILSGQSDAIETIPERIFREEKTKFVNALDSSLDEIGILIETTLNDARGIILKGKEDIECASKCVPAHLQKEAEEQTADFMAKFDDLDNSLIEKQKEIEESLSKEYVKNVSKLKETFETIRAEAAMPWWEKAWRAIKKVAMIIYDLGKLLLKVLVKAAGVIGDIVAHPLRFIENLFGAVKKGFGNFVDNIGEHLEKIIFKLILGVMPASVRLPDTWDAKGVFSLALDILGLNKENIREKAVAKFGEPVVNALEDTFDLFILFKKEGFAGLWLHIKERIGDLKEQVIGQVKDFLTESIVKAAIKFLLSALSPVSGFIKACETIINMAIFFIENLKNILQLLDSILDSFVDVAKGNIENASKRVESALADILFIGIKFLAALVGIKFDAISAKISKLFNAVRNPIERAIHWMLDKAKAFAEKTGLIALAKKGKAAVDKGKEKIKEQGEKAVSGVLKWLGLKKEFTGADGEKHSLSIGEEAKSPLIVASTPMSYYQFLDSVANTGNQKTVNIARGIVEQFYRKRSEAVDPDLNYREQEKIRNAKRTELIKLLEQLWPLTSQLLAKSTAAHTGEANDPIPISWFKPRIGNYKDFVTAEGERFSPFHLDKMYVPPQLMTADFPFEKMPVGVHPQYRIAEGTELQRSKDMRSRITRFYRSVLEFHGVDISDEQIDHVKELNWGGDDNFLNLWPLDSSINQSSGSRINQQIISWKTGNQIRAIEAGNPMLDRKHFVVKKIEV